MYLAGLPKWLARGLAGRGVFADLFAFRWFAQVIASFHGVVQVNVPRQGVTPARSDVIVFAVLYANIALRLFVTINASLFPLFGFVANLHFPFDTRLSYRQSREYSSIGNCLTSPLVRPLVRHFPLPASPILHQPRPRGDARHTSPLCFATSSCPAASRFAVQAICSPSSL